MSLQEIIPEVLEEAEEDSQHVIDCQDHTSLEVNFTTYLESYTSIERSQKVFLTILELIDILEYVHKSQLVYNDLKPDNIMVDRKTGNVTLGDFGLASSYMNSNGTHIDDSA